MRDKNDRGTEVAPLKNQLCKDFLCMVEIEKQVEHDESELEYHSKVREEVRLIRKGMLNVLAEVLYNQAMNIVKEEEGIEKLEARLKENTTKSI